MLLSIKEMEVRKLPFAETWQPGEIDFADSGARQMGPLIAEGVAELLPPDTRRDEVRVKGRVKASLETECDRCLGRASFPIDAPFDLFYKPVEALAEPKKRLRSTRAKRKWDSTNCPDWCWKIS